GQRLDRIPAAFCQALGLSVRILPMCDQPVPSLIRTPAGLFHFQEYLVQRGGQEEVQEVIYDGVEQAQPAPGVCEALAQAEAIVICPSNPVISIGTILAVPGIRQAGQASSDTAHVLSPNSLGAN